MTFLAELLPVLLPVRLHHQHSVEQKSGRALCQMHHLIAIDSRVQVGRTFGSFDVNRWLDELDRLGCDEASQKALFLLSQYSSTP